uniref:Reverse transcriptase Ty1/copia-type domain-containing protein n=1 Tax=Chromera velia CCMP2878 TaxID=1169474 RepID=A0A0G4FS16_9ALVE|eukprot:Cvel_18490.t1-p1 / transcript=Cvel_18490.t1 / gene=Cvel_18490 / organism=Chromera_velia_CCMP2878 / gene_product=Retrovirus-related Pol polyprotein from transposon, putative / transcript_product=Retrovirus-related Pol polyprotein from transposon, putative / location=Cvel_scaffold1534:7043-10663(-) / protein_length=957 / sequence_SO=supercontig / SO=protein_coding / is_pseudo=false
MIGECPFKAKLKKLISKEKSASARPKGKNAKSKKASPPRKSPPRKSGSVSSLGDSDLPDMVSSDESKAEWDALKHARKEKRSSRRREEEGTVAAATVDTGCSLSLFTLLFKVFVVLMVKKTTRFDLASASNSLTTNNVCTLHIPVRDVHGRLRIAVEKGVLTTEVDEALLVSAKRRLSLSENGGWMKMTGLHSETFKVPVESDQLGDLPTVHFPTNEIAAASAAAVIPSCVQTAFIGRRGGGEKKLETVERIGAALTLGPVYIPEAQAEVERVNQTVKRLLKKIILQLGVPLSCWPAFIPGVENAINETVHSTTRFSPNAVVHGVSEGVLPLAVGDVVHFLEKGPIPSGLAPNSRVGLFGGVINPSCVVVLTPMDRNGRVGRWRTMRLHPQSLKLERWNGMGGDLPWLGSRRSRKEKNSGEGVEDDFDFFDEEDLEFEDDSPADGESVVDSTDDQRERDGGGSEERHRNLSPTRHGPLNAVIKRHSSGALVPLQIVRGGQNVRNSLWGVRLDFDIEGNTSIQGAIEEVKLPEIQQRFRLPSDGRLPSEMLDRLVPPEPPPSESGEGGGAGDFSPVDIDRDDSLFGSALLEEESRESSDGESLAGSLESAVDRDFFDESDVQEQLDEEIGGEEFAQYAKLSREQKREEALARLRFRRCFTVAKCSAFAQQWVKSLHAHAHVSKKKNVAKGHILATPEEIAAGSHKKSDSQELSHFSVCDVFDLDSQTDSQEEIKIKGITLRWVRTWKMKGGKRIVKSRLVARGFQDPQNQSVFETFSGIADSSLIRVALFFAVSMGWRGMKVDVVTAFLQAPLDKSEAVWVKLPSNLPINVYPGLKAGCFVRIQRAVYGLKDAPKKYTSFFKKKAQTVGWKEVAESIFLKADKAGKPLAVMIMHVDDLNVLSADAEKEMDLLRGLMQMDEPEYMDDGDLHAYVGLSVCMKDESGAIRLHRRHGKSPLS